MEQKRKLTKEQQKAEDYAKRLVNDFAFFLKYVFTYTEKFTPTEVQNRLCELLGNNPTDLVINAYRGFGKSVITSTFVVWRLLRNRNEKVLIISGNSTKAKEMSTYIRLLFTTVPLLRDLAPTSEVRDSVTSFDVKGANNTIAPSVKISGIHGNYTGSRASLIIADDIETPENSKTQEMREKLLIKTQEFEHLLIPEMKCSIIYLGTPQSAESIYASTGDNLGAIYKKVIIPIEVPDDIEVYDGCLDEFVLTKGKPGNPIDEIRFNRKTIIHKKANMTLAIYRLQYMLDTTLSDAEKYPLKLKYLTALHLNSNQAPATITHSNDLDYKIKEFINPGFNGDGFFKPVTVSDTEIEYDIKLLSIDSSGSGSDETACSVIGVLNGNIFVLDSFGNKDGYSDRTILKIANKAKEHNVNKVVIEKNFSGGVFTSIVEKFLAKVYPCPIEEIVSRGQKENRIIETIEPVLRNNKLFISYKVIEDDLKLINSGESGTGDYSLFYQMTHITYERGSVKHDDRIDALAIAIADVSDAVLLSDEDELENFKNRELENMIMSRFFSGSKGIGGSVLSRY